MAISHLYPTQRPALDLNFARQKRLDSRVTFTRGSTATYVGSDGLIKTAASGEARFDHDPVTGESLGLLIEESRTNLSAYGEKLNGGTWTTPWYTAYKVTKTYNAATAPNGLTSATLVVPDTDLQQHYISSEEVAVTSAVYTMSIYAKYSGYNFRMDFKGPNRGASFYLNTGTIGAVSGGITASMQALPGGWYRCSITYNTATTDIDSIIKILNLSNFDTYQGDNTSGVYFWGYQIEAGTFATSIIPTSGSTVTRSADVASLSSSGIYDTDSFTILNEPFGSAAGSSTLSLVGAGETPIKRTAVYSQELTQTQINASVGKTDEFWRWRILGSSFGLPNFATDGQVTVDWGDGTVETLTTSDHTFTDGGGYHEVGFRLDSGTVFRPYINNNSSHKTKVVAVGPAPAGMRLDALFSFYGCSNLEAFDATVDATGGTNFSNAWRSCSSLTSFPLIDTSSGINFSFAWIACSSLTSFPLLDTSSGTTFSETWSSCSSLTSFSAIDTSSGINFYRAWFGCSSLTSFPLIDTSSGLNFSYAWYNNNSLTSFPLIDTSSASGASFESTWQNCTSLTSFPAIDTSSVTSFQNTWYNCSSLTSFPAINTSSGTNFTNTWYGCNSLTSFPLIDTSSGTSFVNAWRNCTSLTSFPANFFDSWTGTPGSNCFASAWAGCSLTATSVENILNSIDTSGQSAPGTGPDITINYNAGSGTPSIATAVTNLKSRGWTITLNGVPQ